MLGRRKTPEGEMVQIVSLANHESEINAGEKLNQRDYFLWDRKRRLPLPLFFFFVFLTFYSKMQFSSVATNQLLSLFSVIQEGQAGWWLPAPASLLHKPAPTCQICLKFGCVKSEACGGSGRRAYAT